MALIKRIEVANYLDSSKIHGQWNPDYRFLTFDLKGQNSAVLMLNGFGKTTLANAILLLLTRHRGLAKKVKEVMSPSKLSSFSHFRLEIVQSQTNATADMFTQQGMEVTGETWVYGVCGHMDGDGLSYYYYPGRLEDCPVGYIHQNQSVVLYTNKEFAMKRQNVTGFRWGVTEEDQIRSLEPHFSPLATKRMLNFHLAGGGDKSASIYPISRRKNERHDEALFYSALAPELISGVTDKEGEVGEDSFEKTILIGATRYVGAKIKSEKKKKALEKRKESIEVARPLCESGKQLLLKKKIWDEVKKEADFELIVLKKLVDDHVVPGIPCFELVGGDESLISEIVATPDNEEVLVRDSGLAVLLDTSARDINQLATRHKLRAIPLNNMIGLPKKLRAPSAGGIASKGYTKEDAIFLIQKRIESGTYTDEVLHLLMSAFERWERECDTNPYRKKLTALRKEHSEKELQVEGLTGEILLGQRQLQEISNQIGGLEQGKTALESMQESGLFSQAELDDPLQAEKIIEKEYKDAQQDQFDHAQLRNELTNYLPDWEAFCQDYSSNHSPQAVINDLQQQRQNLFERSSLAEQKKDEAELANNVARQNESSLQAQLRGAEKRRGDFAALLDDVAIYKEIFGTELPQGLSQKVAADLDRFNSNVRRVEKGLASLEDSRNVLDRFRATHPHETPEESRKALENKLSALNLQQSEDDGVIENLQAQLADLNDNKTSPSPTAKKALDLLREFAPVRLVDFLGGLNLQKARQLELLTLFSNHLFAPVLSTPEDAGQAVQLLEKSDILTPVFVATTLAEFADTGEVTLFNDGEIVFNYQAGARTLSVESIFDPQKIAILKKDTEDRLKDVQAQQITTRVHITKCNEDYFLAKKALEAIENGVDAKYQAFQEELGELKEQEDVVKNRASGRALNGIKAMVAFIEMGGDKGQQEAISAVKTILHKLKSASIQCHQGQEDYGKATSDWKDARHKLEQFELTRLSDKYKKMLNNALTFVDKNGPEFMATAEELHQILTEKVEAADKKRRFQFAQAATFLEKGGENWKSLEQKKADLVIELKEKTAKKEDLQRAIKRIGNDSITNNQLKTIVDRKASEILTHYVEKVPALGTLMDQNFVGLEVMRKKGKTTLLLDAVLSFIEVISESSKINVVQNSANQLDEAFEVLNKVSGKTHKAKQSYDVEQKKYLGELEHFLSSSPEGLTNHELKTIGDKRDDDVQYVLRLFEVLEQQYKKESADADLFIEQEETARKDACARLAMMADDARSHIRLFRKILSKTPQSTFIVNANVLSEDGIQEVMEEILKFVEERDREQKILANSASQIGFEQSQKEEHKQKTLEQIREWVYRNIFSNVEVKVIHPDLRAGQPFRYGDTISQGQNTAVGLMLMAKLAEFTMERDASKKMASLSPSRRRRAIAKSQSVMIFDGLFSNLSSTKLIDEAMQTLKTTKGSFQLIGLIHNQHYENDPEVFPSFISVQKLQEPGAGPGFLVLNDSLVPVSPSKVGRRAGELQTAEFHYQVNRDEGIDE